MRKLRTVNKKYDLKVLEIVKKENVLELVENKPYADWTYLIMKE